MMLLHDLSHYYREIEGLSRTFESNEVLTPLQIPSHPTCSQDRYKEFRESLHCHKLPWAAEREHGGIALPVLSEDNRAKDLHFLKDINLIVEVGLPTEQYCDVAQLKNSDVRMNDEQLCLPFPTSHPYEIHISRYTMFAKFRSPEDQDTGIDASSHRSFHPNIPIKAFDVVVLRKTRVKTALCILLHWDFDTYFILEDFKDNLRELMKSPWQLLTTQGYGEFGTEESQHLSVCHGSACQEGFGRGPMNPLILDNNYMKAVGRLTGELGEDVELKETFLPSASQVRPLEGHTACLLQGQHSHESILQEQYSSSAQMPLPLFRVTTVIASYSGTMLSKIKMASLGQQSKVTESTDQKWDVSQEQATLSPTCYQKVHYLDTRPPINKLQKITDTLQTEALYRRQLSGRPELESLPKSACSLSYKDFKPRHLDQHTIRENPGSLSKPGLPRDVKSEESRISLHKLWHQEVCQPAWRPEDRPRETALPEWIPSCEVPRHQTALLELQHSFFKTAAQKHFHDSIKDKDLRDNIIEGKRHKFYGFNAFYFFS
ncbi:LOW QUALITY PROTEIN: sperm-associated microtubule inner protein 4 [Theristicus caerulescens]